MQKLILANNVTEAIYLSKIPQQPVLRPLNPWETVLAGQSLNSTQQWALMEDFVYYSDRHGKIVIPKTVFPLTSRSFVTDLASIPSMLQNALQNDSPQILCGSVVHDYGFWMTGDFGIDHVLSFDEVNDLIAEIMFYSNATDLQRWAVHAAVAKGGVSAWNADCDRMSHPERKTNFFLGLTGDRAFKGTCSVFGGPYDTGVSPSEGLALVTPSDLANPKFAPLFLSTQPAGTTGLARRLNPKSLYIAMRWQYSKTSASYLRGITLTVQAANGKVVQGVRPVDWGPNLRTGRICDLSPGVASALGVNTDDTVTVIVPFVG